jgi:hypothetical protein
MSKNTITYTAADEIARRAHNKAARKSGGLKINAPASDEGKRLLAMSGEALKAEAGVVTTPTPKVTTPTVAQVPAYMVPGPRGGDPVKRLRRQYAEMVSGKTFPHLDNRNAYKATEGIAPEVLAEALGLNA